MTSSRFLLAMGALALIFAAVARVYLRHYPISFSAAAAIYCCFLLLLVLALAPGFSARLYALPMLWYVPYLIYAAGTGDFRWTALMRLVGVSGFVLLVYRIFPVRNAARFAWQDALVTVWLIFIVLFHVLAHVWNRPVNLDFMGRLFLIATASWIWIFVRRLPGLGYAFVISANVVRAAALNFVYFAVVAIPIGFALHFTAWNPRWRGLGSFCADYLEIFLFIALLEELFFRGFLQNLLSRSFGSWKWGQLIAACVFGLFHILHSPFPNWRYVILASIAGWFYGSAFRSGGNLMAPALLHAAVDTVWRTWLTRS